MTEHKPLSQSLPNQASLQRPRSSGSRINISQSLAYARAGRTGPQPEESGGSREITPGPLNAATPPTPSSKIDLASIFATVDLPPASAKSQYLKSPTTQTPDEAPPTPPSRPYTTTHHTGLSVEEELFALSQSLRSHDSEDPDASEHEASTLMQN